MERSGALAWQRLEMQSSAQKDPSAERSRDHVAHVMGSSKVYTKDNFWYKHLKLQLQAPVLATLLFEMKGQLMEAA
jgi:hypothetical protein